MKSQVSGSHEMQWMLGGFMMRFSSGVGQTFFIALFALDIRDTFDLSQGEWGSIYSIATISSALIIGQYGKLVDHFSANYLTIVNLVGLTLSCFGMYFLSSDLTHPSLILILAILGLRLFGQGAISHLATTTIAKWFTRRRGRALAVAELGIAVANSILPIFTVYLRSVHSSWQWVWLDMAVMTFLLMLLILFLIRQPKQSSLSSFSENKVSTTQQVIDEPDLVTGTLEITEPPKLRGKEAVKAFSKIRRTSLFWSLLIAASIAPLVITVYFFQAIELVQTKNWSLEAFTQIYFLYSIANVATGLWAGRLIDNYGAIKVMPLYLVSVTIGCCLVYLINSFSLGSFIFIFMGMAAGSSATMVPALWAEIYGTHILGRIKAFAHSIVVLSTAVGPVISGYLLETGFGIEVQNLLLAGGILAFSLWLLFDYRRYEKKVLPTSKL